MGIVVVAAFAANTARSGRGDHGDLSANQVGRQRRQPIHLTLRPAVFDRHVLALDIAGVFEALAECAQTVRVRVVSRCGVEESDQRHRRLLRPRHERPCHRRAAEKANELTSPHYPHPSSGDSIVSARTSTLIGAEIGIKTNAAVHSPCRLWVIFVGGSRGRGTVYVRSTSDS